MESTTPAPSKPERSLVLFEGVSLAGGLLPDGLNHHCIKGIFFSLSHFPEISEISYGVSTMLTHVN